ncbi:ABC transporter substrate-binding protein [Pseudonocardia sp. TRM90224]|uniref:ABC transporter substrate-binding protein n=1 Tax=Pseudonocardia sp. TRM90224 TaxID=2812678 RepID=UPI001E28B8CC|nr:ABC transporter substrate-binding protein [Pseudonocardia sp. TRM90224]
MRVPRSLAGITLAAVLVLAGCGGTAPETPASAPTPSGAFPVTITHALGTITIDKEPQRVVALGYGDIAVANALGTPIVGATRNYVEPNPNLPYIKTSLPEDVLGLTAAIGRTELERIAAYDPDLILATGSPQLVPDTYAALSGIAPVVAYEKGLYKSSMEDDARLIGKALGKSEATEALIRESAAAIDEFTASLPGLAGHTYLYGQARGDVLPMVVGKENLSTIFMGRLGLLVPEEFRNVEATAALAPGTVGLSYEEAGKLSSADVLFVTFATLGDRGAFESNPIVRTTRPVRDGTYAPVDLDTAIALQAPNVVAVKWLIGQLRPPLEKVAATPA